LIFLFMLLQVSGTSSLIFAENNSIVWIYNLCIHLPVDRHLGCFKCLGIMHKLLKIFKYKLCREIFLFHLGK
jgi:hypothetical protein